MARLTGIALALLGALLLIELDKLAIDPRYLLGNLMILMNCVSWALFLVLVRRLTPRYPPMALAASLFAVGVIVATPICISSVVEFAPRLTGTDAGYLGFIILVPTVGAYAFNQMALQRAEPSLVAAYWYLLPILGTLGAVIRLGERPGLREIIATILICCGLFFSSQRTDK